MQERRRGLPRSRVHIPIVHRWRQQYGVMHQVGQAVVILQELYRLFERQFCRVVDEHRSTQRHHGTVVSIEEGKLRNRFREIVVAVRRTSVEVAG